MKIVILMLCVFLIYPQWAFAACSGSSPNLTSASGSRSDVNDCVAVASDGDTISIPAADGTAADWTTSLVITKAIKLAGAGTTCPGASCTKITLNFTAENTGPMSNTYEAALWFSPDAGAILTIDSLGDTGSISVSGIAFAGSGMENKFAIALRNTTTTDIRRIKIFNNTFTSVEVGVYRFSGPIHGVVYSNTFTDTGGSYGGAANKTTWDSSPMSLGRGDGLYMEDNTFSCTTLCFISGGGQGMGQVVRYNSTSGSSGSHTYVEAHGNQGSGIAATQITEIYGNNLASENEGGFKMRGGKAIIFYNKVEDDTLIMYEEYKDAVNTLLNNACTEQARDGTCTASGAQSCIDSLDSGTPCVCQKINHSYYWNNRDVTDGTLRLFSVSYDRCDNVNTNDPVELRQNTEYFNHNVSYNGTTERGIYCGTSLPAACTVGDGAWITTQACDSVPSTSVGANPSAPLSGTLYRCTSTNTWTSYYTPYTYPHPLRSGTAGTVSFGAGGTISIGSGGTITLQ